jgi:hypothetical protein
VGKTALAVEYAYRHRSSFEVVWWVRAEEPATLVGDYAALADALGLAEAGQADQQQAAQAVRGWLHEHDRWLLILDNAQAPDSPTGLEPPLARLQDLVPQVLHGQVLVTGLLRCANPGRAEGPGTPPDQIATASSANAIATRRFTGSSAASS